MNPAPTVSVGAGSAATDPPNPNHPEPSLRTLPFSSIKVYKNGELLGTVRTFQISLLAVNSNILRCKVYCRSDFRDPIDFLKLSYGLIATQKEMLTPKSLTLICWHSYHLHRNPQPKLAQEKVSTMAV